MQRPSRESWEQAGLNVEHSMSLFDLFLPICTCSAESIGSGVLPDLIVSSCPIPKNDFVDNLENNFMGELHQTPLRMRPLHFLRSCVHIGGFSGQAYGIHMERCSREFLDTFCGGRCIKL